MGPVLIAVGILCAVGAVCALLLIIASKYMAVPVDQKVEAIRGCLPGANCGACGYAGCDNYAAELAAGHEEKTNKCIPGGDKVAANIASILGLEAEDVVEHVAIVRCKGDCNTTSYKEEYQGIDSCAAANLLFGGEKACTFACLGYGDCVRVCPNDAISIRDGLAHVDPRKCVGCGLCTRVCPHHVIDIVPDTIRTVVTCSNTLPGAQVRAACKKGCIGCKKCERECPAHAITVVNNLSHIDYDKCQNCGHCQEICPTGAIVEADFMSATHFAADD